MNLQAIVTTPTVAVALAVGRVFSSVALLLCFYVHVCVFVYALKVRYSACADPEFQRTKLGLYIHLLFTSTGRT